MKRRSMNESWRRLWISCWKRVHPWMCCGAGKEGNRGVDSAFLLYQRVSWFCHLWQKSWKQRSSHAQTNLRSRLWIPHCLSRQGGNRRRCADFTTRAFRGAGSGCHSDPDQGGNRGGASWHLRRSRGNQYRPVWGSPFPDERGKRERFPPSESDVVHRTSCDRCLQCHSFGRRCIRFWFKEDPFPHCNSLLFVCFLTCMWVTARGSSAVQGFSSDCCFRQWCLPFSVDNSCFSGLSLECHLVACVAQWNSCKHRNDLDGILSKCPHDELMKYSFMTTALEHKQQWMFSSEPMSSKC